MSTPTSPGNADGASDVSMIGAPVHLRPLAYLLGLEGLALLRAYAGEHDGTFIEARIAEIRDLLASADQLGDGEVVGPILPGDGYDRWAPTYDAPGNAMLEREQPIVEGILRTLPIGAALDAACGTGRHSAYLSSLGHRVTGVDVSAEMLAVARPKVPAATFRIGDLHELPCPSGQFDVVVCGLALTHVRDLGPAMAELTRVLRPGGHLVISDSRGPFIGSGLFPILRSGPDGTAGYVPGWSHPTSSYLRTALDLGLQLRGCEEVRMPSPMVDADGPPPGRQPLDHYDASSGVPTIWSLHPRAPAATNAAYADAPSFIVLHFERNP